MDSFLTIRNLVKRDIPFVTACARKEGFAPGVGDVSIYSHTDRQGLWVGWLGQRPIGCIAGVRYNQAYGFIGLFIVIPEERGKGYGLQLWRHAMEHLEDLPCIGLEAAPDRLSDYSSWGFKAAAPTTRWQLISDGDINSNYPASDGFQFLEGDAISAEKVQMFDACREPSPRPHFISRWLQHPAGTVLALMDDNGLCHGFGRIRPCLLQVGEGWRIGPLLAESSAAASMLLRGLIHHHSGVVLIDAPGSNPRAAPLLEKLGYQPISQTVRMYRGQVPITALDDIYGLACLELG